VEVLKRLADHYERFAEVQSKFISALIYPAVVACVGDRDHYFLHDLHVAKVHDDLRGLKVPLPPATQILMGISKFFGNIGNWLIMGMVGIAISVILSVQIEPARQA